MDNQLIWCFAALSIAATVLFIGGAWVLVGGLLNNGAPKRRNRRNRRKGV